MKPYSKKYLTLALAGVLAASIPASAFAEGPADQKQPTQPAAEQPKNNKNPEAKEK